MRLSGYIVHLSFFRFSTFSSLCLSMTSGSVLIIYITTIFILQGSECSTSSRLLWVPLSSVRCCYAELTFGFSVVFVCSGSVSLCVKFLGSSLGRPNLYHILPGSVNFCSVFQQYYMCFAGCSGCSGSAGPSGAPRVPRSPGAPRREGHERKRRSIRSCRTERRRGE